MSDLLRGCFSGNISAAVSWATGVMSGRSTERIQQRIAGARQALERQLESGPQVIPGPFSESETYASRRAA